MEMALTKSERVIRKVREMILSGELSKGDMLPSENDLSALCGVSRVTTRKALSMLTDMGLIETRRGVGSFVVVDSIGGESDIDRAREISIFKTNFHEAISIKRLIDPEIAKQLALQATDEDLENIEQAFKDMEESFQSNIRYKDAGHEFHMSFVLALKNPTLTEFYEKLEEMESPFDQLYLLGSDSQTRIKAVDLEQHRGILEAIKAHDQDKAYYLSKIHLEYFEKYYAGALDEES